MSSELRSKTRKSELIIRRGRTINGIKNLTEICILSRLEGVHCH